MEKPPLIEYFVKDKDTLIGIAIQHGMTVAQLKQTNKLTQPNVVIFPGQKLMVYSPAPKEKEESQARRKTSNVSISPTSTFGSITTNAPQQSPTANTASSASGGSSSLGSSQPSAGRVASTQSSPSPLSAGSSNAGTLNPSPIAPLSTSSSSIPNTNNNTNSSADSIDLHQFVTAGSSTNNLKLSQSGLTSTGRRSRQNSNVGSFGTGSPGKMPRALPFLVTMRNKLDRHYCSNNFSKAVENKLAFKQQDGLSLLERRKLNLFQETMSFLVQGHLVLGLLTIAGDRFVFEASLDSPEVAKFGLLACQLAIFLADILYGRLMFSNDSDFGFEYSVEFTYKLSHHQPILKKEVGNKDSVVKRVSREESDSSLEVEKKALFCASLETLRRLQKYLKRLRITVENFEDNSASVSIEDPQKHSTNAIAPDSGVNLSANESNPNQAEADEICIEAESNVQFDVPALNQESKILNESLMKILLIWLPERYQFASTWYLIYGTAQHGISLNTFYRRMETRCDGPSICVIKTSRGEVFGGYASEPWEKGRDGYYGDGETFLFTLLPVPNKFPWTEKNSYFQYSNHECLAFGGGTHGRFGLWMDSDFDDGNSTYCSTFDNPALAKEEFFSIIHAEFWCFEDFDIDRF